jgi:aspartate aminotransferase-like enzyme
MTYQLRVPGPTPVPERVQRAMSVPMINHRGPEFAELMVACKEGLGWAFQTRNEVLILTCSGTGGLEAAVQNLTSPGDKALFVTIGAFGDRFVEIGEAFGLDVVRLQYPWGHGARAQDVGQALDDNSEIGIVFVTHNETSTGVTNDMKAIASEVKQRGKLIAVDGISSVGSLPLATDELGLDLVISGSQKGWMTPPGLAFVSLSDAALERVRGARTPRFYFDFLTELKYEQKGQTHSTPAVSLFFGLREALQMMREEGLENIFTRHQAIARGVRAAVRTLELELLADPAYYSDTITAVKAPRDAAELNKQLLKTLRENYQLILAGGQGHLDGRIFRIGHLGDITRDDAREIVETLERGLIDVGYIDSPVGAVDSLMSAMAEPAPA